MRKRAKFRFNTRNRPTDVAFKRDNPTVLTLSKMFQLLTTSSVSIIYTLCSKKTRDHIFDDNLKWNCPFTKIFGSLITKSIGHRQVYLVSNLTYFVQLLYFGKSSRPKYHEFSLKFLIFSMLQY